MKLPPLLFACSTPEPTFSCAFSTTPADAGASALVSLTSDPFLERVRHQLPGSEPHKRTGTYVHARQDTRPVGANRLSASGAETARVSMVTM
jgi:hypothetical protein